MMTPEEFREQYAKEQDFDDWETMRIWYNNIRDEIAKLEDEIMKAYALHVMERVEKEVKLVETINNGRPPKHTVDKSIFEELKKELK